VNADGGAALAKPAIEQVNEKIQKSEQTLTEPDGLPGRPWYRHLIYAPGFYTGYGVKTMPGAREAIEQHEWAQADSQIVRIGAVLNAEAMLVADAAHDLTAASK
jgi:N-acetylated-alpha-linked acidic dipeptidase